ncbi:hypothetical protein [Gaoshiqia sediminis]|uniref:Uncharacterized protein n=1 Tax=Gaoshiqia sediminis TaxID=2986998 RepID=A0AA41YAN7_9BACT|nr:hypothetical protein [Gaoshiqia sediminis]MCW0481092.1 hypothetical protein [Gaoshiqia sediminis]
MTDKKIEYIENLLIKRDDAFLGGSYNLIIHSILNTIDLAELIDFYLLLPDSELKKSIESNIYKRVGLTVKADGLYDRLYKLLQNANYNQRQRIRKILMLLLPLLDNIYRRDFFNNFYNSMYSNDISSALTICSEIWDTDLNTQILNDYLKTKKEMYLKAFLVHGEIENLLPHLKQIWKFEPTNYVKIDIIRKLSKKHIDKLEFIRNVEPEKYLLAMSLSDKEFDNESLIDCLNDIPEDLKPFGILSLSRMNKWELIEEEIKKYVC